MSSNIAKPNVDSPARIKALCKLRKDAPILAIETINRPGPFKSIAFVPCTTANTINPILGRYNSTGNGIPFFQIIGHSPFKSAAQTVCTAHPKDTPFIPPIKKSTPSNMPNAGSETPISMSKSGMATQFAKLSLKSKTSTRHFRHPWRVRNAQQATRNVPVTVQLLFAYQQSACSFDRCGKCTRDGSLEMSNARSGVVIPFPLYPPNTINLFPKTTDAPRMHGF